MSYKMQMSMLLGEDCAESLWVNSPPLGASAWAQGRAHPTVFFVKTVLTFSGIYYAESGWFDR